MSDANSISFDTRGLYREMHSIGFEMEFNHYLGPSKGSQIPTTTTAKAHQDG